MSDVRALRGSINCRMVTLRLFLETYTQTVPELRRNQLRRPTVAFWIKAKLGTAAKPSPCGVPNFGGFRLVARRPRNFAEARKSCPWHQEIPGSKIQKSHSQSPQKLLSRVLIYYIKIFLMYRYTRYILDTLSIKIIIAQTCYCP